MTLLTSAPLLPLILLSRFYACSGLVVPISAANPSASLTGLSLPLVGKNGDTLDVGVALSTTTASRTMVVLGTHAGDFNTIEYCQRLRHFLPELSDRGGVSRFLLVVNGEETSCELLSRLLDLPEAIEILSDPTGEAGRRFGASRGWRPDDVELNAFFKLFVVGIGLGPPWGTLPAVLAGYVGDPNGRREWIEAALRQGQLAGRSAGPLPDILNLDAANGDAVIGNRFDDFPLVGGWGRRPLELATLRLQNIIGIQFEHWNTLKPIDDRCLTQLGGCAIVGCDGEPIYSWVDQGLCDVPDFDEILEALDK